MKTILAICSTTGPQSGKSTLCRVLKQRYPDAIHMRFSDPLIRMLYGLGQVLGLVKSSYDTFLKYEYENLKRTNLINRITGRDFLVAAGDAIRKNLALSFYADILMQRIHAAPNESLILIDDFRKQPELKAFTDLEANRHARVLFINVIRPDGGLNDCEFDDLDLKHRRYFEYTWDGKGGFVERGNEV